jgi:hypothetical protein
VEDSALRAAFAASADICGYQPACIQIPSKYTIYTGDIHGSSETVGKLLSRLVSLLKNNVDAQIVFTGDYDEGPHPWESIFLMLKAQEAFPGRVFVLRGNHDGTGYEVLPSRTDRSILYGFGFGDDQKDKFAAMNSYNAWADTLPLAAFIGTTTAACHGMWPIDLNSEEVLDRLDKKNGSNDACESNESILTWGDLIDGTGAATNIHVETGRECRSGIGSLFSARGLFGFGRTVLVKGHNHDQAGDHQMFDRDGSEFHFFVAISYAASKYVDTVPIKGEDLGKIPQITKAILSDGRRFCACEQPDPDNAPGQLFANYLDDGEFIGKKFCLPV